MIPGIITQNLIGGDGGSGTRPAVSFNSCALTLSSLSCSNNAFLGFAGWFKEDWSGDNKVAWVVDPLSSYSSYLAGFGALDGTNKPVEFNVQNTGGDDLLMDFGNASAHRWHHMIGAAMVNADTPSKLFAIYVDDVKQTISSNDNFAFTLDLNGKPLYVGSDGGGNNFTGSMADLSIWFGIDLMQGGSDISLTVRRAFIDGSGIPVDPSAAISLLGSPPIFLTGPASSFANNTLGTSGAFTISAGSLSDDPSGP